MWRGGAPTEGVGFFFFVCLLIYFPFRVGRHADALQDIVQSREPQEKKGIIQVRGREERGREG